MDRPQGDDWWQASDGKWYPLEAAPPPPPPPPAPVRPFWQKWQFWVVALPIGLPLLGWVLLFLLVLISGESPTANL